MRTKLQITPSTDLEQRLSAVQQHRLRVCLPHGSVIAYLAGSLLFTCLYFVEFLAILPNVNTATDMTIFIGAVIIAGWALNRYNHQAAAQWKQQTRDQITAELYEQRLTYPDIDIAELQQLLTRLNIRIVRTSDNMTTSIQGAIESAFAIARLEKHGAKETLVTDTGTQPDRTDDPLVKFKPGWYVLYRSTNQQAVDYQVSALIPVKTIDQLVDIVVRILLSKVKFARTRSAK